MSRKNRTLRLGPLSYSVEYIAGLADGGTALYGQIEYKDQIIRLDEKNSRERHKLCLVHEILHAIDHQYSIELSEENVKCLSFGIMDALDRNKWLRDELCQQ